MSDLHARLVAAVEHRLWVLPNEPGPKVTKLSCRGGDFHVERDPDYPPVWVVRSRLTGRAVAMLRWPQLLAEYAPLSEVTSGKDETP